MQNPRAVSSRVRKPRSSRKSDEASELEYVENKLISEGELAGQFQVRSAMAAKVTKAIKVPQMLHKQLLWYKRSPPAHPTLSLEASVSTSGYEHIVAQTPPATRRRNTTLKTLADTGCQACCMGLNSSHFKIA